MSKETPKHRVTDQTIEDLVAHVEWKMGLLPDLAERFNLSGEVVDGLRDHLQSEIDYLHTLPPDATLRDVMKNHFEKGAQFRENVTGKKEDS